MASVFEEIKFLKFKFQSKTSLCTKMTADVVVTDCHGLLIEGGRGLLGGSRGGGGSGSGRGDSSGGHGRGLLNGGGSGGPELLKKLRSETLVTIIASYLMGWSHIVC